MRPKLSSLDVIIQAKFGREMLHITLKTLVFPHFGGGSIIGWAFVQHVVLADFMSLEDEQRNVLIRICFHLPGCWRWNKVGLFSKTLIPNTQSRKFSFGFREIKTKLREWPRQPADFGPADGKSWRSKFIEGAQRPCVEGKSPTWAMRATSFSIQEACWSCRYQQSVNDGTSVTSWPSMNLPDPSGHLDLVFYQFPESEPDMEKLLSASMLHMSGTNSQKASDQLKLCVFKSRLNTHLFSAAFEQSSK